MILPGLPFGLFSSGGIRYVGGRTEGFNQGSGSRTISLTGLSGGLSSAPREGDLVVVLLSCNGGSNLPTYTVSTSGYTALTALTLTSQSRFQAFYKVMGSTPDTNFQVSISIGGPRDFGAIVYVVRGVNPSTPLDATTTTATSNTTGSAINFPAITPVTSGAFVLGIGGAVHFSAPTGVQSSDLDDFLSAVLPGNVVAAGLVKWNGGSVNPAALTVQGTNDTTNNSWGAYTLALRPK